MKKKLKIDDNIFRLIIILVVFLLIAGITKGNSFLKVSIFQTMGRQMAEYGLMAVGCGICMISGGIDLSCVYVANLCGISAALLMQKNENAILPAILLAIVIGAACGAFNGFLISYLRIPPMLATLGSYQLFQGISVVISNGSTVSGAPEKYTDFGIKTYMISGIVSGCAGLLSLARINSAKADFGTSYTMQCILIAVLGGVNPNGGFGTIPGIAIAVLILQVLSSYLNTFPDVSNYYRDCIWGIALIGVLILNHVINKKKSDKLAKMGS